MQDTIHSQSHGKDAIGDSTAVVTIDSIAAGEQQAGIVLVAPQQFDSSSLPSHAEAHAANIGMSWIYVVLSLLFCITALKFHGSIRYLRSLAVDIIDTRLRHNAFDDTVKETSLIVLLNALWVSGTGILLWVAVRNHLSISDPAMGLPWAIISCIGVAAAYLLCMLFAYWIVGNVFSDAALTALWIKGAAASSAIQTFLIFPLAIVALNFGAWSSAIVVIAFIVFVIGKILFLYKGFRIFFAQISSWLLFLYYLCSLEIIPVIITLTFTVSLFII